MRILILLFCLVLIPSVFFVIHESRLEAPSYLPGWFILRLDASDAEAASAALIRGGVEGSLSEWNADVTVMTIPETQRVRVADLDDILSPGDPRRDPFLSSVADLFRSGSSSLIYLPADRGIRDYRKILESDPVFTGAEILDDNRRPNLFSAFIFLCAVAVFAWARKGRRIAVLVSSIPVLVFFLSSGANDPFPYLALPVSLVLFSRRGWKAAVSCAAVSAAVVLPAASLETRYLFPALIAFLSSAAIFFILPGYFGGALSDSAEKKALSAPPDKTRRTNRKKRRTEHVLFEPVSLVKKSSPVPNRFSLKNAAAGFAALAVLLVVWIIPFGGSSPVHDPVPSAAESYGKILNRSAMAALDANRDYRNLPDIAALLASVSHQEGFLYGAEYRLPMPGEKLTFTEYKNEDGRIIGYENAVVSYTGDWYEHLLERETSEGVGLLFSKLDGAASVKPASSKPVKILLRANPVLTAALRCIISVMAAILLLSPEKTTELRISERISIQISRRRAQAA